MRAYRCFGYECLLVILMAVFAWPVWAGEASKERDLGTFGDWHAYADQEGGQTVCYMTTTKIFKVGKKSKGRLAYLMITHRPLEASLNIFSYGAGTPLDSNHDVTIRVGDTSFDLFSVMENAWAHDPRIDRKLADAPRKYSTARILAIPGKKGVSTIRDSFSLNGSDAAYRAIGKACGLPEAEGKKEKSKTVEKTVQKKKPIETKKAIETKKKKTEKAVRASSSTKKQSVKKTSTKKTAVKKKSVKKSATVSSSVTKKTTAKKTSSKKTAVKKKTAKKALLEKEKTSK